MSPPSSELPEALGDSREGRAPLAGRDRLRVLGDRARSRFSQLSLAFRIFVLNAAVLVAAVMALVVTPVTVSSPVAVREAVVLALGLSALLVLNFVVLRRAFAPLTRLTQAMETAEPLSPGKRVPVYGVDAEVVRLTAAFNEMLDRLEAERRQSIRRSLAAQEGERRRVAQELHDEVGQTLTAVLLQLEQLGKSISADRVEQLVEIRETARAGLEEVRLVAQRLRPEALDDLGLENAIAALCQRLSERSSLEIRQSIDELPEELTPEAELVVYRVVQEALTNVLRHAEATTASIVIRAGETGMTVRVQDDGRGIDGTDSGAGVQGMRERALLVGGGFHARSRPGGGTEITLELPTGAGSS